MQNVYIEPMPKGQWGPIDGYTLEFHDGTKITQQVYRSERLAADEIKLRGYSPMVAKVRVTDKTVDDHWQPAA
ncbi:hypothetical protein QCE73_18435 [Caballeronia sp. LZ029]|uniref:hypothetical protein n=1 Tax=Caballeronia sp. LZ029 TaxID=3038564 RepID=UPI00045AA879|nr:hypothetical protein [Caballeronia sp. LZ029]KAK42664.1 ankyrin [Caballeronia jiangsuensis]MDR5745136.1 hypothetical protein [Caballeronia sp. LZ029]